MTRLLFVVLLVVVVVVVAENRELPYLGLVLAIFGAFLGSTREKRCVLRFVFRDCIFRSFPNVEKFPRPNE